MTIFDTADVLDKGLRACLRCSLIKTFSQVSQELVISNSCIFFFPLTSRFIDSTSGKPNISLSQFVETGCENCDFLSMENSSERVLEVSTAIAWKNYRIYSLSDPSARVEIGCLEHSTLL